MPRKIKNCWEPKNFLALVFAAGVLFILISAIFRAHEELSTFFNIIGITVLLLALLFWLLTCMFPLNGKIR